MAERLLKSRDLNRSSGAQVAFNFSDLDRQCDDYLARVRTEAEQFLADAHTEAQRLRAEAHATGAKEGRAAGLAEADALIEQRATEIAERLTQERLQSVLPAMQAAVTTLQAEREAWLREWEASAIRLSAAIAERIVKDEIALRPEVTPRLIAEALQLAAGCPRLSIRMHPDDVAQLQTAGHALLDQLAALGQATVVPDPHITRGGCVIDTVHGQIDARIETQIDRIVEELTQE
jgi:flagellar assembly protein FliH